MAGKVKTLTLAEGVTVTPSVVETSDVINGGQNGAVVVGTNDSNTLILETDNTTAVTVGTDQSVVFAGNVGIGGSPVSGYKMTVEQSTGSSWVAKFNSTNANAYGIHVDHTTSTNSGTGYQFFKAEDASAVKFEMRSNGGFANVQSNDADLSDARVKTKLVELSNVLPDLCKLQIGTYSYLTNLEQSHIGVIAQQVAEIFPNCVDDNSFLVNKGQEDEFMAKAVKNKDLYFIAIKAIQELKQEKDDLAELTFSQQAPIEAKDSKIEAILDRLEKLEAKIK